MSDLRLGIVGAGQVAAKYLQTLTRAGRIKVVAIADVLPERARAAAERFAIQRILPPEALCGDGGIDVVVNLTPPAEHGAINLAAVRAGKHLFSEKPLATDLAEARRIVAAARDAGVRAGCAPETLIAPWMTCARRALEDGAIGRITGFAATAAGPGPEHWHPAPERFYRAGAGPVLDLGPYFVGALMRLLGAVKRVSASGAIAIGRRAIRTGPRAGETFDVEVNDHCAAILEFENGASGNFLASYAVASPVHDAAHPIALFGERGTLLLPDPTHFEGRCAIRGVDQEMPESKGFCATPPPGYGDGAVDLCQAILDSREPRLGADFALAVQETLARIVLGR